MDNSMEERPPTPVAMMEYHRSAGTLDKHTALASVELLRQRKRELEEQIHHHSEHLRMPATTYSWSSQATSPKKLLQHSQVRVIKHPGSDDDDNDDSSASSSSASSWGDTNVGPETTVGGGTSCAQDTNAQPKAKLSSFLRRAEHRVQVSNEVSSVSCSEFGDSFCAGEDGSLHDSISTYLPSLAVMKLLFQQHSSDGEEDGECKHDWNPNDKNDLRQQQERQKPQSRSSFVSTNKRLVDTSTLGVFVPSSSIKSEVVSSSGDSSNTHRSGTNISAANTNTTEHSCSTGEDVEMGLRSPPPKTKSSSTATVTSQKVPIKMPHDQNDPTMGSAMDDDLSTLGASKHQRSGKKSRCLIISAVILLLAVIIVALLALIGVMVRNSVRHS
jgi:hypothetical protein